MPKLGARRTRARDRGQSVVELALILPVLLLLLGAAFDLGRGMAAYAAVVHAAREGAWVASQGDTAPTAVEAAVEQALSTAGLDPARATVTVSTGAPGEPVTVTVVYAFEPVLPLPLDTVSLRGSATMMRLY